MARLVTVLALLAILTLMPLAPGVPLSLGSRTNAGLTQAARSPIPKIYGLPALPEEFSFVSNFEDLQLDGWTPVSGVQPVVVTSPSYSGEPALYSTAGRTTPQVDIANEGFVTGDSLVSFQVAIDAGSGSGIFGLGKGQNPVAFVGVSSGEVVAGSSLRKLQPIEHVPGGTAFPAGWVYLLANVNSTEKGWVMSVWVDSTNNTGTTISVPLAAGYSDAIVETVSGTVLYSDIIVQSVPIPIYLPGYNNMEGYGQGSGDVVNLLPAFTELTAQMTLNSWKTPEVGILSFQINAMNYTGTTVSTCAGFFQLGLDLDPHGTIAPWYVPNGDCEAYYFTPSPIPTPPGSHLTLSIFDEPATGHIRFVIDDTTTGRIFSVSIPYTGSIFFGSYTQLEFQPYSSFPIQDFKFSGSLYDMQITTKDGSTAGLTANYMLPFVLDSPSNWDFTYYQTSILGYQQIS